MSDLVGAAKTPGSPATEVRTDDELCAQLVIDAYTRAMKTGGRNAFEVAVKVWREHYPNASPEMASPAVATLLCYKI